MLAPVVVTTPVGDPGPSDPALDNSVALLAPNAVSIGEAPQQCVAVREDKHSKFKAARLALVAVVRKVARRDPSSRVGLPVAGDKSNMKSARQGKSLLALLDIYFDFGLGASHSRVFNSVIDEVLKHTDSCSAHARPLACGCLLRHREVRFVSLTINGAALAAELQADPVCKPYLRGGGG